MMEYPEELEPNVFYEPRPATAPFVVMFSDIDSKDYIADGPFKTRADAEEAARTAATNAGGAYYVLGAVSISSCPVKASTRALV